MTSPEQEHVMCVHSKQKKIIISAAIALPSCLLLRNAFPENGLIITNG